MARGKPFGKGRSGNPKGRPKGSLNLATLEIKDRARAILDDEAGQAKLLDDYRRGKLHPGVVQMLHHYAFGKPRETVKIEGDVPAFVLRIEDGDSDSGTE